MPSRSEPPSKAVEAALREEREFVLAFGGYALEIPGAVLVTNERVPVPRFNFIQDIRVGRGRLTAFFERALDHYFQRALRPSALVGRPVPTYLAEQLHRLGFREAPEERVLLLLDRGDRRPRAPPPDFDVRPATPEELDAVAAFWTGEREREEFRRSLDVITEHPNPLEEGVPLLARKDGQPVATGFFYRHGKVGGIHGVATRPEARGQGAATAVVEHILANVVSPEIETVAIWSESERLARHLGRLGFEVASRYAVFLLPKEAELLLPASPPPGPPLWRPPRRPPAAASG